ncbi:MAG: TRAP transporter small permease subunit [Deltaproteobacteria bacterium]|nr:TRAP transporter small permease subunit [Deltaproteobacteria bacterium]
MERHEEWPRIGWCEAIDNGIRRFGHGVMWVNAVLVVVIIVQVVLRYGFGHGLVALEELEWHLYAVGIMFGISYAMVDDSHIRVDILHMRFSPRTKAKWEVFGILVFLLPFLWVVFHHSLAFVYDAWRVGEGSDAPSGLPWRWVIKAVIPLSIGLVGLATVTRLVRAVTFLVRSGRRG